MSLVLDEARNGVRILTLNRPEKRNALNTELRRDLIEALAKDQGDATTRVVVLTGAGKAFAAGADLAEMSARTALEQRAFISPPHIYDAVRQHPKPVIAAVNGAALGAGCELAMACDTRIAGASAQFGQPEIRLGILPGGGGTQRLTRLVGRGRAFQMLCTGEAIDAARALAYGLVEEVVADADLLERAHALGGAMAAMSPVALRTVKDAVRAAEETVLPDGLAREIDLFSTVFMSEDRKEGLKAFLEKRTPQWSGR
jgi:enoyl-CoA hydratase